VLLDAHDSTACRQAVGRSSQVTRQYFFYLALALLVPNVLGLVVVVNTTGNNGTYRYLVDVNDTKRQVSVYVISHVKIPEARRLDVAEFITRANYGITIGKKMARLTHLACARSSSTKLTTLQY
jgi:hypothetical protein